MALRIYNTRTGEKEVFVPLEPGRVHMYVCGVTTYDLCHIGHGRASVTFDVIARELRRRGFEVVYVRNYTDVDDKIIRRAQAEGVSAAEVAERYVQATRDDMAALGCLAPSVEPRVTEHMPEILALVETLVTSGHAYASSGDVYFSVQSFPPYGSFSGRKLDELQSGARIEINEQKRDPLDFALWKAAKPGEPAWQSPWGDGRPGWHIECSAMGMKYLGKTFDIHGGGSDLIFPHHENEIAQSEAATGEPFARYWMHNGMITVDKAKMAKSARNFFTIRDALIRFHREALRIFLLSTHYRSPVDFSNNSLEEAEAALERFYQAATQGDRLLAKDKTARGEQVRQLLGRFTPGQLLAMKPWEKGAPWDLPTARWTPAEQELFALATATFSKLEEAFDDDFNTARALGNLFELARGIGRFLTVAPKGSAQAALALAPALIVLRGFCQDVLGVLEVGAAEFQQDLNLRRLQGRSITVADIEQQLLARQEARGRKDWAAADLVRQTLAEQGIMLEDTPDGTVWKVAPRGGGLATG